LLTLHAGGSPPCEGVTDEKIITILEPPVVSCGPDAGICESSQFPVQAASADHYISLLWSTTGTGSFNDPATLKPVYTPGKEDALAGSVLLILTAIPADGCPPAADTLKLTVNASPVVNAGPDLFLELNTSGTIHSSVSGGSGAFAYSWHPAELLNDPTVADPVTVSLNINVTFTLTVLDLVTGCTGKDSMKAVMTGTTLVPFAVDDFDSTSMNVPVTIPHLVNDFNPFQEPFSFRIIDEPRHGSGQPFNDSLINYTPYPGFQGNDSLTYEIYYSEGHPQTDTAVVHIHVGGPIPLHIFNTISPNGDGVNDEWIIRGIEEFPDNEVTVFNRWGDVIRTWTRYDNVTNVWDGSNKNNRPVPDGTYFYVIKAGAAGNFSGWIFVRANTD
jgi:gliding motility-associated-like protein